MDKVISELRYYQTFNRIIKRWNMPMRKTAPGKSVPIKNLAAVISPTQGYGYAIYRMAKVYNKKLDDMKRPIWATEVRKKNTKTYIYYELRVTKIVRDMTGGANYEVRNW